MWQKGRASKRAWGKLPPPPLRPDVVLAGKDDDAPCIGGLHEPLDHLVEFAWLWFPGNLDGLGNTDPTWALGIPKSVLLSPARPATQTCDCVLGHETPLLGGRSLAEGLTG